MSDNKEIRKEELEAVNGGKQRPNESERPASAGRPVSDLRTESLTPDQLGFIAGGDIGIEIKPGGGSDLPSGNSTGPEAFGILKCPNCGKDENLEFLGLTSEGNHFRCPVCGTEFTH